MLQWLQTEVIPRDKKKVVHVWKFILGRHFSTVFPKQLLQDILTREEDKTSDRKIPCIAAYTNRFLSMLNTVRPVRTGTYSSQFALFITFPHNHHLLWKGRFIVGLNILNFVSVLAWYLIHFTICFKPGRKRSPKQRLTEPLTLWFRLLPFAV